MKTTLRTTIYRYPRRQALKEYWSRKARNAQRYLGTSTMGLACFSMATSAAASTYRVSQIIPRAKPLKKPKHRYTRAEREKLLAQTIWAEARGEGDNGMFASALVILNRVKAKRPRLYGSHIEGVVLKKWAFSCWLKNDVNYWKLTHITKYTNGLPLGHPDRLAWAQARQIAHLVLERDSHDPTNGATNYYASWMAKPPRWASKMKKTATWGQHIFLRPWTKSEIEKKKAAKKAKAITMTIHFKVPLAKKQKH